MCKVTRSYQFERYADKLRSAISTIKDHIVQYHYLTKEHDPNTIFSRRPINTSGEDIRIYSKTEEDNPTFEKALLDWITYTDKPFTVTENEQFTRIIRAGGYRDWILKADIIRNKLEARIDSVFTQIIQDIKSSVTTLCITLDGWTSKNRLPILIINIKWLDTQFKHY